MKTHDPKPTLPLVDDSAVTPVDTSSTRVGSLGGGWALVLAALGVTLLLAIAAWSPVGLSLDVAQPGDRLFLRGFHGDERVVGRSYRWTGAASEIRAPGMGGAERVRVTLWATGEGRPAPAPVSVLLDGPAIGEVMVGAPGPYVFEGARPEPGQDTLVVTIAAPTFRPPGDARDLGIIVERLAVESVAARVAPLAWAGRLLRLLGLTALLSLVAWPLRRWAPPAALVGGAGLLVAAGALLVQPWLLALAPWLLAGLAVAAIVLQPAASAWLLERCVGLLARRRVALAVMLAGAVVYGAIMLNLASQMDLIGHADYADNAVVARNLVRGNGYTVDYVAQFYLDYPRSISHPADVWPLLHPTLIAVSFLLFGVSTFAAKLPGIVLMVGLLLATFAVGRALFGSLAGLAAAALLALDAWFFQNSLLPVNDVGFSLLAFGLVALGWRIGERERDGTAPSVPLYLALGALAGLLFTAKPSGALLAVGLAAWWLWQRRPGGPLRWPAWRYVVIGAGATLLLAAPVVGRSLLTFGRPFFTTETYDAWVLKWDPPDENIYRLMTGDHPHPRQLVGYGLDRVTEAVALQFRKFGAEIAAGDYLEPPLLPLAALGLLLAGARQRRQFAALAWAVVPYLLFVQIYWHYELRYYVFLIPWLCVLVAGAVVLLGRLVWARAETAQVRLALALLALGLLLVVPARLATLDGHAARLTSGSGDASVGRWLAENTEPDAVVMTRLPWQVTWHSERRSVMIPLARREEIFATMRRYGVDYLLLTHPDDRRIRREELQPLYDGREAYGMVKVYETPTRNYIVYRVPADIVGEP